MTPLGLIHKFGSRCKSQLLTNEIVENIIISEWFEFQHEKLDKKFSILFTSVL